MDQKLSAGYKFRFALAELGFTTLRAAMQHAGLCVDDIPKLQRNPAHYLGMDKDIGSLEVGKLADLLILDGDILADIRQSDQIHRVMLNGRLYDPATMNEVGQRKLARKPFFFEGAGGSTVPVQVRAHAHGDAD